MRVPDAVKVEFDEFEKVSGDITALDKKEYGALLFVHGGLHEEALHLVELEEQSRALSDNPGLANPLEAQLDALLRRVNGVVAAASGMVQGLSARAAALLGRVWQAFTSVLMWALRTMASKLRIDSWSVGITGGFPSGISGTITITFKP